MNKRRTYTRRQLYIKYGISIICAIAGIVVVLMIALLVVRASGKRRLQNSAGEISSAPTIITDEMEAEDYQTEGVKWQEGWVRYNGQIYEYNKDIMAFLIMGIDSHGVVKENEDLTSGGQADALFLVIVNPLDETIKIMAVNRDTMVDVNMLGIGAGGSDIVYKAQIATSHGFGDGMEESCRLTEEAVSKLLFNIPISGYASINYDAIPMINDSIGGVEVVMDDDWTSINPKWSKGSAVTLMGADAYDYVHYRDTKIFASQEGRLEREKNYLKNFIQKAKDRTKSEITLPISIYNSIKDYVVTDLTIDEMGYLATKCAGYSFDSDDIYTMEGEIVQGEDFEEFYPDMKSLQGQIIELFYKKVD